jgi:hypothetical protein
MMTRGPSRPSDGNARDATTSSAAKSLARWALKALRSSWSSISAGSVMVGSFPWGAPNRWQRAGRPFVHEPGTRAQCRKSRKIAAFRDGREIDPPGGLSRLCA